MSKLHKPIHIFLACVLTVFVFGRVFHMGLALQPDSPRYIKLGLDVADYFTGAPGTASDPTPIGYGSGGPFVAFEIGFSALIHDQTRETLTCIYAHISDSAQCGTDVSALLAVYSLELLIFHVSIGLIAYLIFGNCTKAWLAVLLSLLFRETRIYSTSILTEPSYMMTGGVFVLLWVYCWKNPQTLRNWFLCGLALGVVLLVKPAWQALLPALAVLLLFYALIDRTAAIAAFRPFAVFVLGACLVFVPFIIRNGLEIDVWRLTNPGYLPASLAHRFASNAMTWSEWAMGWIYYLPNFGDNLANSLFGADKLVKLGWGPESYYVFGRDVLEPQINNAMQPSQAGAYLLKNHFFNDTVRSIAVTLLLTWRGIFVGSLFGVAAVVLMGPILYFQQKETRKLILLILLPPLIMAGVHGLVSVSLTRYNLVLIVPYTLILAQFLYGLGVWTLNYCPPGLRAKAKTFFPRNG